MIEELGIKRGNFGSSYKILVKNVDYSDYTAKIYIESTGGTMLVNGNDCSVAATDNNKNTLVTYVPVSGTFGSGTSLTKYNCEITFFGSEFMESTESFKWQVYYEIK